MQVFSKSIFSKTIIGLIILSLIILLFPPKIASADGGVNTGQPGSTCEPVDNISYSAPGPGVSTTGLPDSAPAYYEIGLPAGAFLGKESKGIMITIHGGGWFTVGAGAATSMRSDADIWRKRGWETLNITYRGCADSLNDILWFYDAIRAQAGPTLPICAIGQSAGAHLSLMLAAKRADVACVISQGGPTDLVNIGSQTPYKPELEGAQKAQGWATAAFGAENLASMSPVNNQINARVLLANAETDWFIPWEQLTSLRDSILANNPNSYVDLYKLTYGSGVHFTHGPVTKASYDEFLWRELNLISTIVPAVPGGSLTRLNDIRLPSYNNNFAGLTQTGFTLSTDSASATVNGQIFLGPGKYFKLTSCIGVWPASGSPHNRCEISIVSTAGMGMGITAAFPSATYDWSRASSEHGFVSGFQTVSMSSSASGPWTNIGSSLPDTSFVGAGFNY